MLRILIACALITVATAADTGPVRDPFAGPATTATTAAPAPSREDPLPELALEGLARAGGQAIAILRVGKRRLLVTTDKPFICAGRTMRLVSIGDGEVLLREQRGAEHPLGIGIPPPDARPAPPPAPAPADDP